MTGGDINIRTKALDFTMPVGVLSRMFMAAPEITYKHVRNAVGRVMGFHRREFLARSAVDVGDAQGKGMRAGNLSARQPGSGYASRRTFFYRVEPGRRTMPPGVSGIDAIKGETFTTSEKALGLELGGTFRAKRSRLIAIPIGITLRSDGKVIPAWSSPTRFRRGKRPKSLVAIEGRHRSRSGGATILYWSKRTRGGDVLLPAFMLVEKVTRQPRLRFMRTWDEIENGRRKRFGEALDGIVKDMRDSR